MVSTYEKKTASLWRSYDYVEQAGEGNPYKLLCAAIVFRPLVIVRLLRNMERQHMTCTAMLKGQ